MAKGKQRGFNRRQQKLHRPTSGKGIILDLKKRVQARQLRTQRKEVIRSSYSTEAVTEEMRKAADLLVTVFREEDVDPYAAMTGMSLLLVEMALSDGLSKEDLLSRLDILYDEVRKVTSEV